MVELGFGSPRVETLGTNRDEKGTSLKLSEALESDLRDA